MLASLINHPNLSISLRENHIITYSGSIDLSFISKTEYAGDIIIGFSLSYKAMRIHSSRPVCIPEKANCPFCTNLYFVKLTLIVFATVGINCFCILIP